MLGFSHARRNLHELSYLFMQCKAVYLFVFFFFLFLVILAVFQLKSIDLWNRLNYLQSHMENKDRNYF